MSPDPSRPFGESRGRGARRLCGSSLRVGAGAGGAALRLCHP